MLMNLVDTIGIELAKTRAKGRKLQETFNNLCDDSSGWNYYLWCWDKEVMTHDEKARLRRSEQEEYLECPVCHKIFFKGEKQYNSLEIKTSCSYNCYLNSSLEIVIPLQIME